MTTAVTPYSANRSMDRARHHDAELAAAHEAGRAGVAWDEHRDHRADPEDPHQQALHAAHAQGRAEAEAEQRAARRASRSAAARKAGARAQRIGARTGGYLASAGRSLHDGAAQIPTPGGSGTFLGVLVGILALVLLFVALNHAGAVATFFTGLSKGAQWIISPSTLPI